MSMSSIGRGPVVISTSNNLPRPTKPLPPTPRETVSLSDERDTLTLINDIQNLSLQHAYNQSVMKLLAEKNIQFDTEINRLDGVIQAANLVESENHRKAIGKLLALAFEVKPEGLIANLSLTDAQKFEFDAKQRKFAMGSEKPDDKAGEAAAEVVLNMLKSGKITKLNLSVFTSISDKAWERLCKGLPETCVKSFIFSQALVPSNGSPRDKQFKFACLFIRRRDPALHISTVKE